jgi:hypothetical protein
MALNPAWVVRKKRMVEWAKRNNVQIPKGLRYTPTCGAACRDLIRRIQIKAGLSHRDGKWREDIRKLVTPKATLQEKVLLTARGEIGTVEAPAGSNSGKRVREYQDSTNLSGTTHWPWCGAFTSWCHAQNGRKLTGFATAYVPSYVTSARAGRNGLSVVSAKDAIPGDLVCFDWGRDGVSDHIGILATSVTPNGSFSSVEGNTSFGDNSNGGKVMLRDRNTSQVQVFVRVDG